MPATNSDIPAAPLDLMPLALRSVSNQVLTVLIHVAGRIDTAQLQQALHLLVAHYPILACRLSTENRWPCWRPVREAAASVSLIVTETQDHRPGPQAFSGIDQDASVMIVANVLRGPQDDTLYISVDHTVADAAGAKELVYSLASYYAQLTANVRLRPLPQPAPQRGLREIRAEISTFRKLIAICTWRPAGAHWSFPRENDNHHGGSAYVVRDLGEQSITRLKAYGKRYAATINDILVTAFFSSLHDLHGISPGERLPVQFTIDLRRYLPPGRSRQVANLSSSTHVWLRKHDANPFGQNLLETHSAMTKVKKKMPGIGSALVLELIFKLGVTRTLRTLEETFNASRATGLANPLFMNTGVIDDDRLNFGSLEVRDAYMLGPSLLTPGLAMTASGFRDKLTLSIGLNRCDHCDDYATTLLNRMIRLLAAACRPTKNHKHLEMQRKRRPD